MGTANSSDAVPDVTCDGLLLALVANQLRTAWHAGVIDAETAMRGLDRTIREICRPARPKALPWGASCRSKGPWMVGGTRTRRVQSTSIAGLQFESAGAERFCVYLRPT